MLSALNLTKAGFQKVYAENAFWDPIAREIAVRSDLVGEPVRQTLGSNIAYAFGNKIVKLFPSWSSADFDAERLILSSLTKLPIPEILATGEISGWPYLIMTQVPGVAAISVWDKLDLEQKKEIVMQLGRFMADLHRSAIPTGLRNDWRLFLDSRLRNASTHHNVGEPWKSWIGIQLSNFEEPDLEPVLLHGDLTQDHVLLVENEGEYSISGVIDFGDARIGHPFYDFIVPLLDYVYGAPVLSEELIKGYGLAVADDLRDVLTRYCLLHEFATLDDHLERVPTESPADFQSQLWA